jgi:hypothetical protein
MQALPGEEQLRKTQGVTPSGTRKISLESSIPSILVLPSVTDDVPYAFR